MLILVKNHYLPYLFCAATALCSCEEANTTAREALSQATRKRKGWGKCGFSAIPPETLTGTSWHPVIQLLLHRFSLPSLHLGTAASAQGTHKVFTSAEQQAKCTDSTQCTPGPAHVPRSQNQICVTLPALMLRLSVSHGPEPTLQARLRTCGKHQLLARGWPRQKPSKRPSCQHSIPCAKYAARGGSRLSDRLSPSAPSTLALQN